ncbi:hypothetical protein CAPTEDRAFT_194291 [Capitella teleta]|uniref:Sulfotransferase domain-containing protein n=1 Tax=Capitella teleta TaxID=283909 RepID=R7UE78_CAPTE|nr:hypothetical protein CAPTEDRAFT_194291 [Capitella teleta]|eukprot:ELU04284.1 hypothetical protein CAPTEDRAFT_194291 [Capitella teleta]
MGTSLLPRCCCRNQTIRQILKTDAKMVTIRWVILLALLSAFGTIYLAIAFDFQVTYDVKSVPSSVQPDYMKEEVSFDPVTQLDFTETGERLLAANGPRKLFLFAYMHGGSTLLFKLFDQDPRTFAWYETLGPLYGHMYGLPGYRLHTWIIANTSKEHEHHYFPREVTDYEITRINQLFKDMFSCNFESLPTEVFTDAFIGFSEAFRDYFHCYLQTKTKPKDVTWNRHCVDSTINPYCGYETPKQDQPKPFVVDAQKNSCPEYLEKARVLLANRTQANITKILEESYFKRKMQAFLDNEICLQNLYESAKHCMLRCSLLERCQKAEIQVTKILRLKLPFMEPVIRAIPDMQIIYYTRDPRAIAASRLGVNGPNIPLKFVSVVTKLCEEMQSDVAAMEEFEERYPNIFLRLRYEDLVEQPDESVKLLFGHIAMDPTRVAYEWIHDSLHGDSNKGVQRTNGTYIVNKWKSKYDKVDIDTASGDVKCRDVLQKFGYV